MYRHVGSFNRIIKIICSAFYIVIIISINIKSRTV